MYVIQDFHDFLKPFSPSKHRASISKKELAWCAKTCGWTEFRSRKRRKLGLNVCICSSKQKIAHWFTCAVVELKDNDLYCPINEFPP